MKTLLLIANCAFPNNQDILNHVLSKHCPQNVQQFKTAVIESGLQVQPAMVANRGIHNPSAGSFSFFESDQKGHLYFGHFTGLEGHQLELDQANGEGKLLIEAIAWDFKKRMYNFYELRGSAQAPKWFFQGDSKDAYLDNVHLKRQPNPSAPQFGRRMRCSACHTSGGPIMKELEYPHNDWWKKERPLKLGMNYPSAEVEGYLKSLISAQEFSTRVKKGMHLLGSSMKLPLSWQEKLRPLFCTTEMNLISDKTPLTSGPVIQVSSELWLNPLLLRREMTINKTAYKSATQQLGIRFPEGNLKDADHAYLAPVVSYVNLMEIKSLVSSGLVDEEFAVDVLSVDFTHPLFSNKRCELLKLIPNSGNWKLQFAQNLSQSALPGAKELLSHLMDQTKSKAYHRKKALEYLTLKMTELQTPQGLVFDLKRLDGLRKSVFRDEISKNPLGQILEPGFRVVFPMGP